jgi:hypothetical protein
MNDTELRAAFAAKQAAINRLTDWQNCPTPDCSNKTCLWSGEELCALCAERKLGQDEMSRRYLATHQGEA